MRGLRYDRILAGTALALVLALPGHAVAAPNTVSAVETPASPAPETSNQAAPDAKDSAATPAAEAPKNEAPAAAAPAATAVTPDVAPVDAATLKSLTGKDLVKAPIASNLSAADAAVAEKLRDLLATKGDRFFSRKGERPAAEAFYRDRGFAPLWIDKGAPSARATAAIAYLRGVDADGLDPADYPVPEFKPGDADALADAELKYTSTIFTYARHAQTGRVHFSRVSADIAYNLEYPDPSAVLAGLAGSKTVGESLSSYNPPHAGYKALKAKLAEARGNKTDNAPARIEKGPVLKTGKELVEDSRVPLLRKRLGLEDSGYDQTYDKELEDAVIKFQKERGLPANGQLTAATIDAMNGPRRDNDVDVIIANMERWRWLPRDLGYGYVMLNIPDFTLKVMNDGKQVWTTKVVTGKPGKMATPLLSETMKFITVNPTWNVPPSIINNEYLPALQQDPGALERIGLKMEQNKDGTVRIFQPPGAGNALGRIRFNFPNKFLVYQHDTPDKFYFAHEKRAYSHGCMRVQNPDKYAEVLLNVSQPNEGWTAERINKMYGSGEQNINITRPIWVHITYQTAFVDDAGKLQIREDVYGRDATLLSILKGSERKVADIPIERHEVSEKPQVARLPQQQNSFWSFFQGQNNKREFTNSRDPRYQGGRQAQDNPISRWFR